MRMNRGTIGLIAILLVVIIAVLVINNNQASAPGVTPTVAEATGPLLPGVTADTIVHYEVRDNTTGNFTSLTKDSGGAWHIDGTNTLPNRDPDQSLLGSTAGQIVSINYNNTFQSDQLANYGLVAPAYTVEVLTSDHKFYTLYIGSKAPTSSRYYAILESTTAEATPEATTASGEAPQAIATSNVAAQEQNGGNIAPSGADATAEATAESTAAAKKIFQAIQQATAEATAQMTAEPASEAMAATAEVTAEATANVIQNPGVTLSGNQTIYVIPQTVIDTMTKWIATPPYAPLPTPMPTDIVAPLELPSATSAITAEPTAEATAAATAAQ